MAKKVITKEYRNLGEIINATGIADTASASSEIIYNTTHVRRIILHMQSTQSFDLYVYKIKEDGTVDWGNAISTGLSATGAGIYSGLTVDSATSVLGYACRFAMINKSGGAVANFKLEVELLN
jgi:hypothetical protein